MKKTLLFVFFLFQLNNLLVAQAWIYHPMPSNNAVWHCTSSYYDQSSNQYTYYTDEYFINGDTTIAGRAYHQIFDYHEVRYGTPPWLPPAYSSYGYCSAIREDSVKRVYVYAYGGNPTPSDMLLYDFNLQVGDTLPPSINDNNRDTIRSIDSVLVGNNYHKRFNLSPTFGNCTGSIIEGVGNTLGLLYWLHCPEFGAGNLDCFTHYDSISYPSVSSGGYICPLIALGIYKTTVENNITISPNPFTSQTTISFSTEQRNTTIKIMDVVGKEIKTINFTGKQYIIEKGTMQSGVYFVQIADANKNVVNRKVVVE